MRILRRAIQVIACLPLLVSTVSGADIPRMINYQSLITDDLGDPINQNGVSLEFSIYDASVGGDQLWLEGPIVKDITDGLLSHPLGSVVSLPDSIFTDYAAIWLEVSVNAEALPRVQLMASAYAFRVSTVDSARGGAIYGEVEIRGTSPGYQLDVGNNLSGGGAGNFHTFDFASTTPALRAQSNGSGPTALVLHDLEADALRSVGDVVVGDLGFNDKIRLEPTTGLSNGGRITMLSNDGDTTATVEGDYFGRGRIAVRDTTGTEGVTIDGLQAKVTVVDPRAGASGKIDLLGKDTFDDGAAIDMFNAGGQRTIYLDTDVNGNGAAQVELRDGLNDRIVMEAFDGSLGGAKITLYDGSNTPTVVLDSDNAGDGRVTTEVLEITGGADLSEQFDISPGSVGAVEPGMVLSIDPDRIGHLRVSESAYDAAVAGIVSGAGGVKTGMLMGQSGSVADGQFAVALTGRVWCKVDAAYGAVRPGDLLTTSHTPGHAMKATASDRMQGAIIGKAMSSLETGTGLVLVLVSLQ